MTKKYQARKGCILKEKDAQEVGESLDNLRINNKGHLKTEDVVKAAKDKGSVLHNYFEWDNNKSAKGFRMQQARNLIGSVVEIVIIQDVAIPQRSFFSVPSTKNEDGDSEGKVYVTIQDAIENEDYRKHLLNKIITTLENLAITMKMFKEQK